MILRRFFLTFPKGSFLFSPLEAFLTPLLQLFAPKKDVFDAEKVPIIEEMIREKRLRWFGHLIREKAGDPAKEILAREKESGSKWFQQVTMDLRTG